MKFFYSIFLSFTVWVAASLMNALLSGTWLFFFSDEFSYWPEAFGSILFFTLIFSVSGIFFFWIVLLTNWDEPLLFRVLLKAGLILSILSSLLLYILPLYLTGTHQSILSVCIVIASIASNMIHYSKILSFTKNKCY